MPRRLPWLPARAGGFVPPQFGIVAGFSSSDYYQTLSATPNCRTAVCAFMFVGTPGNHNRAWSTWEANSTYGDGAGLYTLADGRLAPEHYDGVNYCAAVTGGSIATQNVLQTLVQVFDGTSWLLYRNGTKYGGTVPYPPGTQTTARLQVGANSSRGTGFVNGAYACFALSTTALNDAQAETARANMIANNGLSAGDVPGVVHLYNAKNMGSAATTWADEVGSADLTKIGSLTYSAISSPVWL